MGVVGATEGLTSATYISPLLPCTNTLCASPPCPPPLPPLPSTPQVHVFETTIRVLGGLLSGHVLLQADRGLVPGYDGLLLRAAQDLGDRLLAAFDTPSGLPGGHVHLRQVRLSGSLYSNHASKHQARRDEHSRVCVIRWLSYVSKYALRA